VTADAETVDVMASPEVRSNEVTTTMNEPPRTP